MYVAMVMTVMLTGGWREGWHCCCYFLLYSACVGGSGSGDGVFGIVVCCLCCRPRTAPHTLRLLAFGDNNHSSRSVLIASLAADTTASCPLSLRLVRRCRPVQNRLVRSYLVAFGVGGVLAELDTPFAKANFRALQKWWFKAPFYVL